MPTCVMSAGQATLTQQLTSEAEASSPAPDKDVTQPGAASTLTSNERVMETEKSKWPCARGGSSTTSEGNPRGGHTVGLAS